MIIKFACLIKYNTLNTHYGLILNKGGKSSKQKSGFLFLMEIVNQSASLVAVYEKKTVFAFVIFYRYCRLYQINIRFLVNIVLECFQLARQLPILIILNVDFK